MVSLQRQQQACLPLMALLMLVVSASGCQQSTPSSAQVQKTVANSTENLKVVTTFLPMYMFTKAVVGETANVEILVPPGTEVHEYQATPANVKAIATANVLVKNGLGLEEFLESTVKNARNAQLKQINASSGIQPVAVSPVVHAANQSETHDEHVAGNPHVWLDPVLAQKQVQNIRDGLIAAHPSNKATYQANAATYIQQLQQLDSEFKQRLQKYPNCTFITFHDAFPYLAQRYQIKQVAVVELPEDQLSPQDVQNAVNAVKKYNVKALFGEPGVDNKLLTSLSQDLNLTLRPLDSLETGRTNPQHYFTAMKANLQILESACKGS